MESTKKCIEILKLKKYNFLGFCDEKKKKIRLSIKLRIKISKS